MKYLAIYCVPQEYGDPFVHVVNLSDGKIVKTYDIPDGYWNSGETLSTEKVPYGKTYSAKMFSNRVPKVGDEYDERRDCVITSVSYKTEVDEMGTWYHIDLQYRKYNEKRHYKFSAKDDTFRKKMEEQGINMKGWCLYKRRKTGSIEKFLLEVLPYDIINLIRC